MFVKETAGPKIDVCEGDVLVSVAPLATSKGKPRLRSSSEFDCRESDPFWSEPQVERSDPSLSRRARYAWQRGFLLCRRWEYNPFRLNEILQPSQMEGIVVVRVFDRWFEGRYRAHLFAWRRRPIFFCLLQNKPRFPFLKFSYRTTSFHL